MTKRHMLIVGASGVVGRAALEHFQDQDDWQVTGLARNPPDFSLKVDWLCADLQDRNSCLALAKDSTLKRVTHIAYTALYELPWLGDSWFSPKQIECNRCMLENVLDAVDTAGASIKHVTLLQGTKAYGAHLGIMRVPAKESDPRVEHPNFYFDQEDLLLQRALSNGFGFSILRPQAVCGVASGRPMNLVATLGVFASLQKAKGEPLFFPGHRHALIELADAKIVAKAIEWVATHEHCNGETYNITNGDILLWSDFFPLLADFYDLEVIYGRSCILSEEMPLRADLWETLVQEHELRLSLDKLVGSSWQFADILWANPKPQKPMLVSTIKARNHGFRACKDSENMLLAQLERMEIEKLLPPH